MTNKNKVKNLNNKLRIDKRESIGHVGIKYPDGSFYDMTLNKYVPDDSTLMVVLPDNGRENQPDK